MNLFASRRFLPRIAATALVVNSVPGWSHHSAAKFNMDETVTLRGTVEEFDWTNPHCHLRLLVTAVPLLFAGTRRERSFSILMGSPQSNFQLGMRPDSFRPGDMITIVVHPPKSDSNRTYAIDKVLDLNGHPFRMLGK